MKKLIISNGTKEQDWRPVLDEARPFLRLLNEDKSVTVRCVDFGPTPWGWNGGSRGANLVWLRSIAEQLGKGYDLVIYHDPNFPVQGAWGFFNRSISTKELMIAQMFQPLTRTNPRYSEFTLDAARTLVHEVLHAQYFHSGFPDRTHEWQAIDQLRGAIDEITELRRNRIVAHGWSIVGLVQQVVTLAQQLMGRQAAQPECCEPIRIRPLENWDSLKRGYRFGEPTFYTDFHRGLDLAVPVGTPLYAPTNGTVEEFHGPQGGVTIWFRPDDEEMFIRFLHLDEVVKRGPVKRGDVIGKTGNTGLSTGPHLHVDVSLHKLKLHDRANFLDPEKYFA